jgi:2-polyprenyl-6-methoxyphenol hydroxylase-like FAD-dependent oxidoreductase
VAIEAAGLTDQFRAIIHAGGEATRVLDQHGAVLLDEADEGGGGRPEVLRGDLRRILVESLPAGAIQWGRKLNEVIALGVGRHELRFADGSIVQTDLLVGADGAWSKVRPLLSDATPEYVGVTFIDTYLHEADTRHAAAAEAVGHGAMFALAPGKSIFAHREAGGVLHAYIALKRPVDWVASIDFSDPAAAAAQVAAEFKSWSPALTALITDSDVPPVPRMLHTLPDAHRWNRTPGVTLIGDAAHLAPPAGEGANLAMLDGAQLAQAIVANPGNIEAALATYEAAMFPRSEKAAIGARQILEICLGEGAPSSLVDFFTSKREAGAAGGQ